MPPAPDTLTNADATLAAVEQFAQSILALKARRGSISHARRKRIGDRDGWICRTCGQPVDPELKWSQPDRAAIPGLEADLAALNPTSGVCHSDDLWETFPGHRAPSVQSVEPS